MEKIIIIEREIKEAQTRIERLCILDALGMGDFTSPIQDQEDRIAKLRAQLKELEK